MPRSVGCRAAARSDIELAVGATDGDADVGGLVS
jgi:hypothetical protein